MNKKEDLFKQRMHRIEILEGDVMNQGKEIETLKDEMTKRDSTIAHLNADNRRLTDRIRADEDYVDKTTNKLEQYGRRNNIRIPGVSGDANRQSFETTTALFINTIKEKTGLNIS